MQKLYERLSESLGPNTAYVLFSAVGWGIGILILVVLKVL